MKFPYVYMRSVPGGYLPVLRGFDDEMTYKDINLLRYERLVGNLDAIPTTQKDARKLAIKILRDLACELERIDVGPECAMCGYLPCLCDQT